MVGYRSPKPLKFGDLIYFTYLRRMKCNKCKRSDLTPSDFVFKNKEKGVLQTVCKICQREYKLKHYYANKQAHYERNKQTNKRNILFVNDFKRAHPCIVCGEAEIACLDFHHLRDKDDSLAVLAKAGSINRIKKEITKCVILCANCHRKYHAGILNISVG